MIASTTVIMGSRSTSRLLPGYACDDHWSITR